MNSVRFDIFEKVDKRGQEAVAYFLRLLLNKDKYRTLKEEIEQRKTNYPIADYRLTVGEYKVLF